MSVRTTSLAAVVAGALAAVACSGGGGNGGGAAPSTAPPAPTPAPVTSKQSGFTYDAATVAKGTLLHAATLGNYGIDVALAMHDGPGLMAYAAQVSDPRNGSYRHFLTPTQIADRFAATASERDTAVSYFKKFGLAVTGWRQRMLLRVAGSQTNLEAALHAKFGVYRKSDGTTFVAPETAPRVDAGVPVVGSADVVRRANRFVKSLVTSRGGGSGYSPQQIAAAFDYNGAYAAGYTGTGITIGIVGTGPIQTSTGGRIGDADAYKQLYKVAGTSTVSIVPTTSSDPVVNGASGYASPPPVTPPCTTSSYPGFPPSESPTASCNPEDGEAQLDTEQASTLAPDSTVEFYLAYNPNDGCSGTGNASPCPPGTGYAFQGLGESDEELQTIIDHDTADVVSASYGGSEFGSVAQGGYGSPPYPFAADGTGLDPTEFAMMAAEGIAVFASSGDAGANECQATGGGPVDGYCVSYPSTDPNVIAVGGVTTPLDAAGRQVGPISAWGLQSSFGAAGTGGGVSAYFAQPTYQTGLPGIIGTTRNVPDLSLDGDPATGVALLANADPALGGASLSPVGGTSVSSPEMAAMWALVLQACKSSAACSAKGSGAHPYRMGNPNALFYAIYGNATLYPKTFLPVTYGDNSLVVYCYYNSGDTHNCPTPAPGSSATPLPIPAPLASGYTANTAGGYNNLTGIGVPYGRALIKAVVGV